MKEIIPVQQREPVTASERDVPAPMAIFEQRVIHPDNQARMDALKARLERFRPLPFFKRLRLNLRARWLGFSLKQRGVFAKVAKARGYHEALKKLHIAFQASRAEAEQLRTEGKPIPDSLRQRVKWIKARADEYKVALAHTEARLDPFEQRYGEFIGLRDRLVEDVELRARRKAEAQNKKQFHKEAKLIQRALRETFLMTEGCYVTKYGRGGKAKKIPPKFQEVYISSTVHSFVLLTSKMSMFGGWQNKLNVDIENLIDERRTLKNASAILHRQVWVDWDRTHSVPIFKVNRLDIRDGLPERVLFGGLLEIYPVRQHDEIPIPLGLGENFRAHWLNLEATPHLLIAGTTRSGKSTLLHSIICSWLYMQAPEELRLILIDNKAGVEMHRYHAVPHLISLIEEPEGVLATLQKSLGIMRRRLKLLRDSGASKFVDFNRAALPEQKLPRLLIIIDELATILNRPDTEDVHHSLYLLTAQGAAAGVHVIAATQYPNADTIPMTIKGNMDAIIGFRMPNMHGSTMLFNSGDAYTMERNKGRVYVSDGGDTFKSQTPWLPDEGKDRAIRFACDHHAPVPFTELEDDTEPVPALPTEVEAPEAAPATPAPTPPRVFSEADLIDIFLNRFEGVLNADGAYRILKGKEKVTQAQIRQMTNAIRSKETVTYGIELYHPTSIGGRNWRLIPTEGGLPTETVETSNSEEEGEPLLTAEAQA